MFTDLREKSKDRYNARELARILGISHVTLYNWVRSGKLPEPKVQDGKRKYWTRNDLIAIQADKPVRRHVESFGRAAGPYLRDRMELEAE
jgi:excisionase family DNA binding protein